MHRYLKKISSCRKNCRYFNDTSIMYSTASDLDNKTLIIAISMSGETPQVIKAVNIAKTRGCKIICVTNVGYNTLANLSDKCLFIFSSEYEINNIKFRSRVTANAIMEYVFFRYLDKYK
ncbi:SIS domain-containing protein [Clostridium sp. JN-9]|nr:SIS domain-containing protein [Clostridium sp. JN-9]